MKDIRLKLLKEALNVNDDGQTAIEVEFEDMRCEYKSRMVNMDPEYDSTVEEEKQRVYIYLGDDFGIIKLWDLTYVLKQANIEACKPLWEIRGDQYFPNRSEKVNASGYASRLRTIAISNLRQRTNVQDPEDSGMIIRECVGHSKTITKLNYHNFDGLISIGNDNQVRIWSFGLDLWGIIDCRHYE